MGAMILKVLMMIWSGILMLGGGWLAVGSCLSAASYLSPEARYEYTIETRIGETMACVFMLGIAVLLMWAGFRLMQTLMGRSKPIRRRVPRTNVTAPARSDDRPAAVPVRETPVKAVPTPPVSACADNEIIMRWSKYRSMDCIECRAAAEGYELCYSRDIFRREPQSAGEWHKIPNYIMKNGQKFGGYIRQITGFDDEAAAQAVKLIGDFIRQRERRIAKDGIQTRANGSLRERIRYGFEPKAEGISLHALQAVFMVQLFTPFIAEIASGQTEKIAVDRRDSQPYYIVSVNENVGGKWRRRYDVKEPVTWEEVVSLAESTKDASGKKYLQANADTWRGCCELRRKSATSTKDSCTITWQQELNLRREVGCRFEDGKYWIFYGGDHGPTDRTGFYAEEEVPEAACQSREAFYQFAGNKLEDAKANAWAFMVNHRIDRIMAERGVRRPPSETWGEGRPSYAYERYIELKFTGRPPHEYEQESLVRYSGGWFLHSEAAWRGGFSHSDGGSNDTFLIDVNDENVDEYVRKRKNGKE